MCYERNNEFKLPSLPSFGKDSETGDHVFFIKENITTDAYIYLNKFENSSKEISNLCQKILENRVTPTYIFVNSYGGSFEECLTLINAIKILEDFRIIIRSTAYSAGAIIFTSCPYDARIIAQDVNMMFHNYSGFVTGRASDMEASIDNNKKFITEYMVKIMKPYFTRDELGEFKKGKEIWLREKDILDRDIAKYIEINRDGYLELVTKDVYYQWLKDSKKKKKIK